MHIVHLPGILHNGYELSAYVDVTGDRQAHDQAPVVTVRRQELGHVSVHVTGWRHACSCFTWRGEQVRLVTVHGPGSESERT